jgi:hypothetical protein
MLHPLLGAKAKARCALAFGEADKALVDVSVWHVCVRRSAHVC